MSEEQRYTNPPSFTIRELTDRDIPFIFNSYLRSNQVNHPFMPHVDYYDLHHIRFKKFLDDGATVFVVHPTDEPDVIAGWLAFKITRTEVIIYYAYTKQVFRGFGVLKSCLEYLHTTLPGHKLVALMMLPRLKSLQQRFNIRVNPYRLEE